MFKYNIIITHIHYPYFTVQFYLCMFYIYVLISLAHLSNIFNDNEK